MKLSQLLYLFYDSLAQRAYFQICGWEERRDEALLYDELLKEKGIETKKDVYPGLPQGRWTTGQNWKAANKGCGSDVVATSQAVSLFSTYEQHFSINNMEKESQCSSGVGWSRYDNIMRSPSSTETLICTSIY